MKRVKNIIALSLTGIIILITAYNLCAYQGTLLEPLLRDKKTAVPNASIGEVLQEKGIPVPIPELWLMADKSEGSLALYSGQEVIKSYKMALGKNPIPDKQKAGDRLTPSGEFTVLEKKTFSPPRRFLGSRLMLLSYPDREDALRGLHEGLITSSDYLAIERAFEQGEPPPQDTPLGGNIGIHGGRGPFLGTSWTNGSIGLFSKDVEEIFEITPVGTRVVIRE